MVDGIEINFPCDYPIKIIGDTDPNAVSEVLLVVRRHAPEVTPDQFNTRASKNGNFQSLRVTIVATGEVQLKALHQDLLALPSVRLVL
ncbi:MAG: putative lipoic acid-binding regulatory protein [Limisphaerales bacterium]